MVASAVPVKIDESVFGEVVESESCRRECDSVSRDALVGRRASDVGSHVTSSRSDLYIATD